MRSRLRKGIRGTNQYQRKSDWHLILSVWLILVMAFIGSVKTGEYLAQYTVNTVAEATQLDDEDLTITPTPSVTPQPELSEVEKVESYIYEIFGRENGRVAFAIALAESGLNNQSTNISRVETSIGIFQINIQSETAKVHFSKIPGDTLEAKKQWLRNPYNNTLIAYKIFTASGFYPWSVYQNSRYLDFLE